MWPCIPPPGYACQATEEEIAQYLNYEPRGECPDDWLFVQSLVFQKNCFALPKRRCVNKTPKAILNVSGTPPPTLPSPPILYVLVKV